MKYLISGLLLFMNVILFAQPAFKFSYDASGNRIKRELIDLSELPEEPHEPGEPEVRMADPLEDPDAFASREDQSREGSYESQIGGQIISVFPNPTLDKVTLEIGTLEEGATGRWRVVSVEGKLIAQSDQLLEAIEIDLSNQADGRYILHLQIGETRKEWLIVKE